VTQITIQEAVTQAMREFLPVKGIVGVSSVGRTIVFYVETPEDAAKVPPSYWGYPTIIKVTRRVVTL